MVELVIDASVLSAFFLNEDNGQEVQQLVESDTRFYAPSVWRFEVANAVWKRKEIQENVAEGLIEKIWDFTIYGEESTEWIKEAFLISRKHNIAFYDSTYIAMARSFNIPFWTFDKVQHNTATHIGVSLWR